MRTFHSKNCILNFYSKNKSVLGLDFGNLGLFFPDNLAKKFIFKSRSSISTKLCLKDEFGHYFNIKIHLF